jgi:hypothetical protein
MTDIVLVQASRVLPDADVIAALPSLTAWAKLVTDTHAIEPATFSFMQLDDFLAGKGAGAWPIFLNKHSTEPNALGFHDVANGAPYGRSFSGDDILDRISPWVTLSHEAGEIIRNPMVQDFVTLRDGSITPRELCDAVEDDIQAIVIDNIPYSNFVYPTYWDVDVQHPLGTKFDYQGRLSGPCPALTPGGYLAILPPGPGQQWGQITARRLGGGGNSVRAERHHNNSLRARLLQAARPQP